ncbi:MAG: aldehyde dehydrogenase family protein [Alphaproteobacteria bacterium]
MEGTEAKVDPASVLPRRLDLYYGGAWHVPVDGARFSTIDPATGRKLAEVASARADDVGRAVASARAALPGWRALPPLKRAALVRGLADILRRHKDELALLDAFDSGNPVRMMSFDVDLACLFLEYFAGLATEIKGETIPMGDGALNYTLRQPLGVVARIIPYNHPILFLGMKIAAPLVAGNTVILKPAEQTPLTALRFAELLEDALPPGVLNILPGGAEAGAALTAHPDVRGIAVVGSVPTGRAVLKGAADSIKRCILELGGKNALIVYPDADVEKAIKGAVHGMNLTWCTGQSCGSTSRVFVHESQYDRVVDGIAAGFSALSMGMPTDPATEVGCLVSHAQYQKVLSYIDIGKREGARLVSGGGPPDDPALANGFFVRPTVFADVVQDMRIASEEIFGPVISILKWSDDVKMLADVNRVEYGLTASIWTRDLVTAHRAAAEVEAGYVWINSSSTHFPGAPFGGYKQSGLGREECLEELLSFTETKNINVALS